MQADCVETQCSQEREADGDRLATDKRPRLGLKYEAACRYNLGYAYERNGDDAKAVVQYNEAIDVLPGSLYAKAAQAALKRRKKKSPSDDPSMQA